MKLEFMSTNLPHNCSHGLFNEQNYDIAEGHIDKLFNVLMYGSASVLKELKSKDNPVVLNITNKHNKPIASAIVEYFDNENADAPGNWSLRWTFEAEDIPENAVEYDFRNPDFHGHYRAIAGTKFHFGFHDTASFIVLMTYILEQLYKWLDENATEKEIVEIELDNVFTASVQVENGVKEFALIPAGEVKTIIKDDASIEK